jgi:essential nuclear protein 1
MPKATTPVTSSRRHNPLEDDITATGLLKNKAGKRKSRHEEGEEKFVDSKASRKILKIAQDLADEDQAENQVPKPNAAFDFSSRIDQSSSDDEDPTGEDWKGFSDEEYENEEEQELDPKDRAAWDKFFPEKEDPLLRTGWGGKEDEAEAQQPGTNLADLILEKIAAFEAAQARGGAEPDPVDEEFEIPEKVVEVYTKYALSIVGQYSIHNSALPLEQKFWQRMDGSSYAQLESLSKSSVTNFYLELVSFYHDISPGSCPSPSKSFLQYHDGKTSSK